MNFHLSQSFISLNPEFPFAQQKYFYKNIYVEITCFYLLRTIMLKYFKKKILRVDQ